MTSTKSQPARPQQSPSEESGDPLPFEEMIEEALRRGPATAHELVRRIDALWPRFIGKRAGLVHPALLDLERQGRVESCWLDLDQGRRRVHRLADRRHQWPTEGPLRPREFETAPESLRSVAERATRTLSFAPRQAEEARFAVLGQLLDLAAEARASGSTDDRALREATDRLGDPWKIRTDLARTLQGRRTVLFPRSPAESLIGIAIYDLRILLLIVAAILFVRVQVVTAYHIPSKSMEPTLHGHEDHGDRILVNKLAARPARGEIWVFDGWKADRKNYVKRCMGLPEETIALEEGDVYVDGELLRKDGELLDALLFPVFRLEDELAAAALGADDDAERLAELDRRLRSIWDFDEPDRWRFQGEGGMSVDVAAGEEPARLHYGPQIVDGLYDADTDDLDYGRLDYGDYDVPDLRTTTEVLRRDEDTALTLRLRRGELRIDLEIGGAAPGARLVVDGDVVAELPELSFPVGEPRVVRFGQVDRVVRVEVDGELVARHDLPVPDFRRYRAPRGFFDVIAERGGLSLAVRSVERDVYYTPDYGDSSERRLGPDEYLMLGDNSNNSTDGRSRGPVHVSRLVGRPMVVVYPLRRLFHMPR